MDFLYRVVIADDHPVIRLGVRRIVESSGAFDVVGEASNSRELMIAIDSERPHLIVTDLSMDKGGMVDGLAMIGLIKRRHPNIGLIVFTISSGQTMMDSLVRMGVKGVVSKRDQAKELAEAIRYRDQAGTFVSEEFRSENINCQQRVADAALTTSEVEVLRQLADNLSVSAIATRSSRTKATISKQKSSAMKKLRIDDDAQLYAYLSQVRGGLRPG